MNRALVGVALFSLIALAGCNPAGQPPGNSQAGSQPKPAAPLPAATWMAHPPEEWPQLVLTNYGEFNGHTPLEGSSAFLVKTRDGRTLAATASHLITPTGGVDPEIPIGKLDSVLRSWQMFPRTLESEVVEIDKLAVSGLENPELDWLLLTLKKTEAMLPAEPLALREQPVTVGEQVYLVGCPYVEADCKQNVYVGKVTARQGDRFRYDIDPPVDLRGFSGAPIIDSNGHAVGVMTVWFDPRRSGDKYLEAGGEDVASIYGLVETSAGQKK